MDKQWQIHSAWQRGRKSAVKPKVLKLNSVRKETSQMKTNSRFQMQLLVLSQIHDDRGLRYTMRHDLHWLDITDRIEFRVAVIMYRCLHDSAPEYLSELFMPGSNRSSRYRSAHSNQLVQFSTYGGRSFTVSGPTVWNSLPDYLRDPSLYLDSFRR